MVAAMVEVVAERDQITSPMHKSVPVESSLVIVDIWHFRSYYSFVLLASGYARLKSITIGTSNFSLW